MRADRDPMATRALDLPLATRARDRARARHADVAGDDCAAPEFVSQLVDVSQELADVIASANAGE